MQIKGYSVIKRHAAHQYAEAVLCGKITASLRARQACERYMRDLEQAEGKGWRFNYKEAAYVIDWFATHLRHPEGKYAGEPFILLPWQQFVLWNLHGFERQNSEGKWIRRFKYAYVQIPKKNGKTTLIAGHSLYMMLADGEASPEIYYTATTRDQAKLAFNGADKLLKSSPDLQQFLKKTNHSIYCEQNFGSAKPLSADANTSEGINPYYGVIDEYHVHDSDLMYNGIKAGMIAREQPMHFTITTAGFDVTVPCFQLYESCCDLLDQKFEDDSSFCIIYEIDEQDDWMDEASWVKANPSTGHSVTLERMREEFKQASNNVSGSQVVNFKTKHLNIWCNSKSEWIKDEAIKDAMVADEPSTYSHLPCYAGLDLAAVSDLTALAMLFVVGEQEFILKLHYWLPEDRVEKYRSSNQSHPYLQWVNKGYITTTPGNVTDYDSIRQYISGVQTIDGQQAYTHNGIMQQYDLQTIAYDRFNSSQLVVNLTSDGVPLHQHGQGFVSMSLPTKEFERMILGGKIKIIEDPVLRWMVGNVAIDIDPAGNTKPNKKRSKEKIDGVVAAIMALGASIALQPMQFNPEDFKTTKA